MRPPLTTHVLDTAHGRPAAGVMVSLFRFEGGWIPVAEGTTDQEGRVTAWSEPLSWGAGRWRLRFDVADWYRQQGSSCFFPRVDLVFDVSRPEQHHHVPLLLTPHGYTTYRGS